MSEQYKEMIKDLCNYYRLEEKILRMKMKCRVMEFELAKKYPALIIRESTEGDIKDIENSIKKDKEELEKDLEFIDEDLSKLKRCKSIEEIKKWYKQWYEGM